MDSVKFGRNKQSAREALKSVEEVKNNVKNNTYKERLLKHQTNCLENSYKLFCLEDSCGMLTSEICENAVKLSEFLNDECDKEPYNLNSNDYQNCLLGIKTAWSWLEKLMECSKLHLKNASEYHQFFHSIHETSEWMPVDLKKAEDLLRIEDVNENKLQSNTNQKLLLEIKTALTIFITWQARVGKLLQQSKTLSPLHLRNRPTFQPFPAVSLADYTTEEINLQEGEEVLVVDNQNKNLWKVKNMNGNIYKVPSVILAVSGQNSQAVEVAMKLCLKFLFLWTEVVRKYGKTIILFLLHVIRVWNSNEEKLLVNLKEKEKKEILHLLSSISQTFSPCWDEYPPYKTLQERSQNLKNVLNKPSDPSFIPGKDGHLLVIQTIPLEDLLAKYREFWAEWQTYKVLLETTKHPQYLLCVENWDQYKFIDPKLWTQKWQTQLSKEEQDSDQLGRNAKEEEIRVERSKQTAESSRLYTSHQEERQTFVITGVKHPNTGEVISLDRAVELRIINQTEGKYVNPMTKEAVPIPVAMNSGNIIVEQTSVRKSKEEVKDIGLITITTIKETRPYVLRGIKQSDSDRIYSVDEATRLGLLDQKKGRFFDRNTGEHMNLADALDSGLLIVDYKDASNIIEKPITETKTYQINSVYNSATNRRTTFSEAVSLGLLDLNDGSYKGGKGNTEMYIGDAIKEGFVRAVVVADPSRLEVAEVNKVTVGEEKMRHFKNSILNPFKAMNAIMNGIQNGFH